MQVQALTVCSALALLGIAGALPAHAPQTSQLWTKALVVALPGEAVYHLPECPRVKGAGAPQVMTPAQAEKRGLTAHDCRKVIAEAQRAATTDRLVWVDLKTKRYHLAGCSLVGLPRAQVRLDQAMAAYKPCNACKPPRKE
jgi:hypothetical protein